MKKKIAARKVAKKSAPVAVPLTSHLPSLDLDTAFECDLHIEVTPLAKKLVLGAAIFATGYAVASYMG